MPIICITAKIYVDTDDPEATCLSMSDGLEYALEGFPKGEVIQADVERYERLGPREIAQLGFDA